jgi:thiamine pyrophosphokinase
LSGIVFRSDQPVTLIGAGPIGAGDLEAALALAPEIVAADGGANHPLPEGRRFRLVVGDMDSIRHPATTAAPMHRIDEQETTDLEKCLRSVAAPLFIGLGFLGGRLDHQLAALNAIVKDDGPPVILLGTGDLCFRCPADLAIDLPPGTRLSLFPMARLRGIRSEGLLWTVDGLELDPAERVGTSNETTGGRVRIGFEPARMLVILPAGRLAAAAAALAPGLNSRPGAG